MIKAFAYSGIGPGIFFGGSLNEQSFRPPEDQTSNEMEVDVSIDAA